MSQFLVKVFAILGLTWFNSVYFSVNFSVIFTQLILNLCSLKSSQHSLKSGLHTLRLLKTVVVISSYTWLNLTNLLINLFGLSQLNLGLFLFEVFLVNFLSHTRLDLTNLLINLLGLSQLNLGLFLCEGYHIQYDVSMCQKVSEISSS